MTIQCTNLTCKTMIPVPEGSSYVVCPVCNTWHFPSDYDNVGSGPSSAGSMDYGLPTDPPPPTPAPQHDYPPMTSNPFPHYETEAAVLPSHEPEFHKSVEVEKKAPTSYGSLVLLDGRRLQLKAGQNVIGRKCGELSVEDPTVSRRHCVIEVSPSRSGSGWEYLLYDIGAMEGTASTNGVFLSGRSLRLQNYEKLTVENGWTITLGSVRVVLQYPAG